MAFRRRLAFQPDVLEWIASHRQPLRVLRAERRKMEKGFVAYFNDFVALLRPETKPADAMATKDNDTTTAGGGEVSKNDTESNANRGMAQYYESEELIKRMKWKRVTWDDDADYSSFSRRVLENDVMFKHVPAFSFLSMHVVKDPATNEHVQLPQPAKLIAALDLTRWVLEERDPKPVTLYPVTPRDGHAVRRRSPFTVDWISGEVRLLDTASTQELLTFLSTVAPRLQALQLKMERQQALQKENVENVRVRVGATVKFNEFDTSFWDDPKRKTDANYVNPDEVEQFLTAMLRSALLYRWFLKGQQLRVIPAGRPYLADMETKEVQMPCNFAEYNWLQAHSTFEGIERVMNSFRRFWWFWFSLCMVLIGDVDMF